MPNPLRELERHGQSPWIDMISRELLDSGKLRRLVAEDGLKGLTSNPTIFEKAIASGADYDARIRDAAARAADPKAIFEAVAMADLREGADTLKAVYERSGGADGFVSLEVSPTLAYDTEGTVAEGLRLFKAVGRKNLMIKVPATKQGLPAIERLLGEGVNVNVTLIFSIQRYQEVMNAYLEGLRRLAKTGRPLSSAASVASFFVSRIDTSVDAQLAGKKEHAGLLGKAAIANAKLAYAAFQETFSKPAFAALKAKGARAQRPLWASTSTKNPAYRDVVYVEELIGPDTVNTLPPATLDAFRDHGRLRDSLTEDLPGARRVMDEIGRAGVDFGKVTAELESAGVKSFADSFAALLRVVSDKAGKLAAGRR